MNRAFRLLSRSHWAWSQTLMILASRSAKSLAHESGIRWPPHCWPDAALGHLEAATKNTANQPFEALILREKLLAVIGELNEAHAALNESAAIFPPASLSHAAHPVLVLLAQRMKRYDISIDIGQSDGPPHVADLQVRGKTARFLLPRSIFNPADEFILQRWWNILPLFDVFMKSSFRVDGDVAVNLGDFGQKPGLAFCENRPGYFLIPDAVYMKQGRYICLRRMFCEEPVAWHDRIPRAFWRGSTTGGPSNSSLGWRAMPRVQLCEIGQRRPDVIDAGFSKAVQIDDPEAWDWLRSNNLLREQLPPQSFQQYRYQIDIDGNTNSWPGLFIKLLSGSPVLKVESPTGYRQWYYDRLLPWTNFVPIAADMTDLVEKVDWLRGKDDVARRIGEAGQELAESLTHRREIKNTAPVIAAAIRAAARGVSARIR